MGEQPVVSLVMATNRVSPFLRAALESVTSQTYGPLEVMVIDDGSPDPEALQETVSCYPGVVLHTQAKSGAAAAWNRGVALARGSLIGFLADDDLWPRDWVERHVGAHARHPGAILSYAGIKTIDAVGRELSRDASKQVKGVVEVLRRDVALLGATFLVRKDAFTDVGGFDRSIKLAEDLDLVLKLALRGEFVHVPDLYLSYRLHADNNTSRHRELVEAIDQVVRRHRERARAAGRRDFVEAHQMSLAANRRFAAWSASRAARRLIQEGRYKEGVQEIWWAIRFAPRAPLDWAWRRVHRLLQHVTRTRSALS